MNSLSTQYLSQGDAFLKQGFQNWKRATEKSRGFRKHEMSKAHKEAVVRHVKTNPAQPDVVEMVSTEAKKIRFKNHQMLLKILTNARFLARQALPLRGNWDKKSKLEIDSNFHQLLLLRYENEKELQTWLDQSTEKYTSPTMQNEMLQVLALGIFKEISSSILEAEFYTVMADESADVSNKEQVVICIRWIDDNLIAHEDFISLKPVAKCTSEMIANVIKETINQMRLKVSNLRGQCYDDAAVIAGDKNGIAAKIKEENPKCLYTHCYGHALNLCVKDACTEVPTLTETFAITKEICKPIKKSPQRETLLKKLRKESENDATSVHAFCPTRWTVSGDNLKALINNYNELMGVWENGIPTITDTDMKARMIGAQTYIGCLVGAKILSQTEILSKALQSPELCATEAHKCADGVVKTLKKERCEEEFNLFWRKVEEEKSILEVDEYELPRKRRHPKRMTDYYGYVNQPDQDFTTEKDMFRAYYYQCYDFVTNAIEKRFDQPDYKMYGNMESIVTNAVSGKSTTHLFDEQIFWNGSSFRSLYEDDIYMDKLEIQLRLFLTLLHVKKKFAQ